MMYHTALKRKYTSYKDDSIDYYEHNGNYAFVNNIKQIHPLFYKADCIYSEISWQAGFQIFQERAGIKKYDYKEYIKDIVNCIETLKIPAFILTGKHILKYCEPHYIINARIEAIKLNCICCIWYHNPVEEPLIKYIATEFNVILDFCCGYGDFIPEVLKANKNFICCDINKSCITYIARTYMI